MSVSASATKSVLVTGGAGFIGSHLVDALLAQGHRVTVVDNLSSGSQSNINEGVRFHNVDITDRQALDEIFRSEGFGTVFHHAAQINVRHSVSDPANDAMVNLIGLLNLMESSVRYGTGKIVFSSSGGAVYGEQDRFPADEDHATNPISPYGVAKLAAEKYLFYYHKVFGIAVSILRYANVYGPRQNSAGEAGVIAIFANTLLSGGGPVINGDGKQTRDFVFVGDVVRANLLALSSDGFNTYNVGTGLETDINKIFDLVVRAAGSTTKPRYAQRPAGEQLRSVLDWTLIGRALGWRPEVSLEQGVEKTINWFRSAMSKS
jgi:UDP-glucose 4-epimerase